VSWINERLFRMILPSKSIEELNQRIEDLHHTLNSAVHDIVVLKEVLREKGLMDEALYKRLRIERMLADHGGPGASPWVGSSIYPYTLDEHAFLRRTLGAGETEVKSFQKDADDRCRMT